MGKTKEEIKEMIDNVITSNGNGQITGLALNLVLNEMAEMLSSGDGDKKEINLVFETHPLYTTKEEIESFLLSDGVDLTNFSGPVPGYVYIDIETENIINDILNNFQKYKDYNFNFKIIENALNYNYGIINKGTWVYWINEFEFDCLENDDSSISTDLYANNYSNIDFYKDGEEDAIYFTIWDNEILYESKGDVKPN